MIRDPNWNTNAGAQAVTSLITEKPDVIVVHNPDVQTYAKLLQKAENEGIYVVQINMRSAYRRSVFVGADWIEIGERQTDGVVEGLQGQVEQDRDRAGRAVGGGERLHAEGRRERARQASRDQGGVEPGRRLGCRQGQGASRRRC